MNPSAGTSTVPLLEHAPATTPTRGFGRLEAVGEPTRARPLPLAGVRIRARVVERVAEVVLEQTFVNDHDGPIEAVYTFPLSGGCAVSDFTMTVAGKTTKAELAEREEARTRYQEAVEAGKRAALVEQERSDVFTMTVGNLQSGEEATMRLVYSEQLPFFEDGRTELRLPLVLGPRYVPGQPLAGTAVGDGTEMDTDEVPDASRITPPRLAPGFDPKTALALEVELLGTAADLACSQHAIAQTARPDATVITLARDDERLDRDFVLRWRLAQDEVSPSLVYYEDADGRAYGVLSIVAPRPEDAPTTARDVIFVIDRSGSMHGAKIASAARACGFLLRTLGPADRFGILAFDNGVEWFEGRSRLVAADEEGIARGERWLRHIEARGGTEVNDALDAAIGQLEGRQDRQGREAAIVLVTDGQVGNEAALVARAGRASDVRVFAVGVDTAVNAGFLTRLARAGRGTSALVEPGTALEAALVSIGRDIGRPLVTELTLEDGDGTAGVDAGSLAPPVIPDLFGGRSTMVAFRARAAGPVRVRGTRDDGTPFDVVVEGRRVGLPAIAHIWARERVTDLEDRYRLAAFGGEAGSTTDADAWRREIIETSIAHTVLSRFTAFVAVDERQAAQDPSTRRKVVQPVYLPAAWSAQVLTLVPDLAQAPMGKGSMPVSVLCALDAGGRQPKGFARSVPSPMPDEQLYEELSVLAEELGQLHADLLAQTDVDVDRLRAVRSRLVDLAEKRRRERRRVSHQTRKWLDAVLKVIDGLIRLLEERQRVNEEVRAAVARLGQVASGPPDLSPSPARRRFWDVGA